MALKLFILKDSQEHTFYIKLKQDYDLPNNILTKIKNIVSSNNKYEIRETPFSSSDEFTEIGPKRLFKTSWNTNMIEIFNKSNIFCIEQIEFSIKYPKNNIPKYDKMIYEVYNKQTQENEKSIEKTYYVENIELFNKKYNLGFDNDDIEYYKKIFKRNPTNVELFDLSQSNSEHARHWFFRAQFHTDDDTIIFMTLMDMIKSTKHNNKNSLVSFHDNASVIYGDYVDKLINHKNNYLFQHKLIHFSYKAETHNFPTSICPFPGAATGVGGRIRDTICVGRGGEILAGTAGYSVGEMDISFFKKSDYSFVINSPETILIEASNGASDYGNKIGEPLIQGFTRSYRSDFNIVEKNTYKRIEYLKPIMFSGGIGKINHFNIDKYPSKYNYLIGRVGGAAYRIGIGGGSASSRTQDEKNLTQDFDSVQRGDPEMANKVAKFVKTCCYRNNNPILSIHDQGSGGMANVTRELAEPNGATIDIDKVNCGDNTLNTLEKWVAEYQEQVSFLFERKNLAVLESIARRENVPFDVVGYVNDTKNIKVLAKNEEIIPVDIPVLSDNKTKTFYLEKDTNKYEFLERNFNYLDLAITNNLFKFYLAKVLSHISVCSKGFLVNKVDRSVSGLIVQQQNVGPFQLPLANNAVVSLDFNASTGLVSAIGEQPIKGIPNSRDGPEDNIRKMVRMSLSEMLLNMIWTPINSIKNINSVANWMWASKLSKDGYLLREAVDELVLCVNYLGFSINGGKDSLSMTVDNKKEVIKSPNTLVISGYSNCIDFDKIITPNLKSKDSYLIYISLDNKFNLGGSIFEEVYHKNIKLFEKNKFKTCDNLNLRNLKIIFSLIQNYIKDGLILSGHDISDGGLITTLIEMSISSNIGIDIRTYHKKDYWEFFYSENSGIVIEINSKNLNLITNNLLAKKINYCILGKTNTSDLIKVVFNNRNIYEEEIKNTRYLWESKSFDLEKKQANPKIIEEEIINSFNRKIPEFKIPEKLLNKLHNIKSIEFKKNNKPKVAIFNEEGSNGENEMAYCFLEVGFDVYNVNINDLIENKYNLEDFRGIAFVGGFSFSDVLGAAYGWYFSIINNKKIKQQFDNFYKREDKFSFGICNGCQLMSLLEWIPKDITLETNLSNRFESRYSFVKIQKNNSIMLNNMEDLEFGIWTAHKQGRIVTHNDIDDNLFPIKYIDDESNITERYPYNPNGSKNGRCCIISENGRHLAMMPHPERCVLKYQMPWLSNNIKLDKYTPWMLLFKNALEWCRNN